jgi:hypothetical protein
MLSACDDLSNGNEMWTRIDDNSDLARPARKLIRQQLIRAGRAELIEVANTFSRISELHRSW